MGEATAICVGSGHGDRDDRDLHRERMVEGAPSLRDIREIEQRILSVMRIPEPRGRYLTPEEMEAHERAVYRERLINAGFLESPKSIR